MNKPTYEELEAQVKQLAAENETLLALMQEQSGCFNAAISEGFHDAVMQSGIERLIDIYQRRLKPAIQCIPPTPATDASLRAEGVEMAIEAAKPFIASEFQFSDFDACVSATYKFPESDLVGKVEMVEWMQDFAAQLRSKSEVQS